MFTIFTFKNGLILNIILYSRSFLHIKTDNILFATTKIKQKVKLSCYMQWRHMGEEEV
jgi:hypothetical protein